jgi:hypothetical protein
MRVYVESDVNLARPGEVAAWSLDLGHWGECGQGPTEQTAVADLLGRTGETMGKVCERIVGDERFFERDQQAPTPEEIAETQRILREVRTETIELISHATDSDLDRSDSGRELPDWANWTTPRLLAWHIADTESRYYLPHAGLAARERASTLIEELESSAAHVSREITAVDSRPLNGDWPAVKLLRRLAWHERGELVVLKRLLLAN